MAFVVARATRRRSSRRWPAGSSSTAPLCNRGTALEPSGGVCVRPNADSLGSVVWSDQNGTLGDTLPRPARETSHSAARARLGNAAPMRRGCRALPARSLSPRHLVVAREAEPTLGSVAWPASISTRTVSLGFRRSVRAPVWCAPSTERRPCPMGAVLLAAGQDNGSERAKCAA